MKKIYIFLLFSIFCISNGQQETLKVKELHQVNTYNGGRVVDAVFDQSNHNITIGYSNGLFNFNGEIINTVGKNDLFVYKTKNTTGEKVWLTTLDAGQNSMLVPYFSEVINNDIYIGVELYNGSLVIGNKTFTNGNNFYPSRLLLKIDQNGTALWGTEMLFNYQSKDGVTKIGNKVFTILNGKISILNDEDGNLISEQNFPNLSFNKIKSDEVSLYVSGITSENANINGMPLLYNQCFIMKADVNLSFNGLLKFERQNSSINIISDFYITDDNKIQFLINVPRNARTFTVQNDKDFSITGNNLTTAIGGSTYWLGRFSNDFSSADWFFGTNGSSNNLKIFKGRDNKIFLQNLFSLNFKNDYFSSSSGSVILSLNANGDLENEIKLDSEIPSFADNEFTFDDSNDYLVSRGNYTNLAIKNANQTEFANHKNYKINDNKNGFITSNSFFKVNNEGEIYNSGYVAGYVDNYFGSELNVLSQSFISKLSVTGELLWKVGVTNTYANTSSNTNNLSINQSEDIVYAQQCIGDFNSCTFVSQNNDAVTFNKKTILSKLDKNGNVIWNNFLSSSDLSLGRFLSSISVFQNAKNDIYVTGLSNSKLKYNNVEINGSEASNEFGYTFIIKIDADGNFKAFKKFTQRAVSKIFIEFDGDEAYLFTDFANLSFQNLQFDDIVLESKGTYNFIMLKLDENINVTAGKNLTPNYNSGFSYTLMDVEKIGNEIILYNWTNSNIGLDNNVFISPYYTYQNYEDMTNTLILSKINLNGNVLWSMPLLSKNYPSNNSHSKSISGDEAGNIYVNARLKENLTFSGVEHLFDKDKFENVILKISPTGQLLAIKNLGATSYDSYLDENILNVDVQNENKIYISGTTQHQKFEDYTINDHNGSNYYIAVLEKDYLQTIETKKESLVLYPNPSSDLVFIKDYKNYNQAKLYDTTGKMVLESKSLEKGINLSKLPDGIYYIELIGKERSVSKIIKK